VDEETIPDEALLRGILPLLMVELHEIIQSAIIITELFVTDAPAIIKANVPPK
jgi:hypothetical protein